MKASTFGLISSLVVVGLWAAVILTGGANLANVLCLIVWSATATIWAETFYEELKAKKQKDKRNTNAQNHD